MSLSPGFGTSPSELSKKTLCLSAADGGFQRRGCRSLKPMSVHDGGCTQPSCHLLDSQTTTFETNISVVRRTPPQLNVSHGEEGIMPLSERTVFKSSGTCTSGLQFEGMNCTPKGNLDRKV